MPPKVSIIVPVHNTQKYLSECITSLTNQTLKEIQIIIVNDGSTDDSLNIAALYANNDSRILLIDQPNLGSAGARQTGMRHALGEYVIVCDSDDWVEPQMYETMYQIALINNADLVSCDSYIEYPTHQKYSSSHIKAKNNNDLIKEIISGSNNSSCNKLIKRSIFTDHSITYEVGINLGEDALILYKVLPYINKIESVESGFYHYRRSIASDSSTNSMNMDKAIQLQKVYDWLKNNYSEEFAKYKHIQALNVAFAMLRAKDLEYFSLSSFIKNEILWKNFTTKAPTLKQLMIYATKLCGTKNGKLLLRILYPFFYK